MTDHISKTNSIDLHMHSIYSDDGEISVEELIGMCKKQNMKIVSLTDHNSVKGVERAIRIGKENGIDVLSGIEMDCTYKEHNFHLLGYGFDYRRKEFLEIEEDIFKQEMDLASEKIYKFSKATGIDISEKEVFDAADGAIITGEIIGEIVLNRTAANENSLLKPYLKGGEKSDMPYVNFYWDFFDQGKVAYVPIKFISLNDAIDLIRNAGGISILAHPGQNLKNNFSFVEQIIGEGIDGLEVFSSYHSNDTRAYFYEKTFEHKLLMTCGSDFHGKNKPNIKIGDCNLNISEDIIVNQIRSILSL